MTRTREVGLPVSSPNRPQGSFALLASAAISITGDGALIAAAPLMAATLTQDPIQIGVVAASTYAAIGIFGLPAGALVDRWNLKRTMIVSDAARAAVLAVFAIMVITETATIPALAITLFLVGVGACFFDPGVQAAIPDVVGRDEKQLTRINSKLWAIDTFGRSLAGPPLGAAAFAWRTSVPFIGDAISFLLSALLISRLPDVPPSKAERIPLRRAVGQGISYLIKHRRLLALAVGQMCYNMPYNVSFAMLVLFAQQRLGLGSIGFGLLLATGAVGGVAAGWLGPRVANRVSTGMAYAIALTIQAVVWLIVVAIPNPLVAGGALAVLGATSTVITVVGATARQLLTPGDFLGRIVAVTRLLGLGSAAVGAVLGGLVAHRYGLTGPFVVAVALLVTASLGFLLTTSRRTG